MAAQESNGFAHWVQPAHFDFISVARFIPLRVEHPPPQSDLTENPLQQLRRHSMLAQRCVWIAFYQLPKVGVSPNECGRRFLCKRRICTR